VRRKELTTLLTCWAPSSTPSSASSAEALAPVSVAGISGVRRRLSGSRCTY